jgi:hypothetical protein
MSSASGGPTSSADATNLPQIEGAGEDAVSTASAVTETDGDIQVSDILALTDGDTERASATEAADGTNPPGGGQDQFDQSQQPTTQGSRPATGDETLPKVLVKPRENIKVRTDGRSTEPDDEPGDGESTDDDGSFDWESWLPDPITTTTTPLPGGSTTTTAAAAVPTTTTAPPGASTTTSTVSMATTTTAPPTTTTTASGSPVTSTTTLGGSPSTGAIRLDLSTDPPASSQRFEIATSFRPPFTLGDGESITTGSLSPGDYWVSPTVPTGWDVAIVCDADGEPLDPHSITLEAGDTVVCTIDMTQRAGLSVVKTVAGAAPNEPYMFEVRRNASPEEPGEILASGETDASGRVSFACAGDPDLIACPGGGATVLLVPDTYQVCELGIRPGWNNDLDGFIPGDDDGSSECADLVLGAGVVVELAVDNTPPPGGIAQPRSFWLLWSSCGGDEDLDPVLDDTLASFPGGGVWIGDLFVDTCDEAILLLDVTDLDGKQRSDDPTYPLAAELLAARLNSQAGAIACDEVSTAVDEAQALLVAVGFDGYGTYIPSSQGPVWSDLFEAATALAETLESYNGNALCEPDAEAFPLIVAVPVLALPVSRLVRRVGRRQHHQGRG